MIIFGNVSSDIQIGVLLGNIKHKRPTADVYGLFAKYKYKGKSVLMIFDRHANQSTNLETDILGVKDFMLVQ